jgi:hypothetical protein
MLSNNTIRPTTVRRTFKSIGKVIFPKPRGIEINMMPFVIGDQNSIPSEYAQYIPLLNQCMIDHNEFGKIGYLSVTESLVNRGSAQRRTGIHTERPNTKNGWGGGYQGTKNDFFGGLYMASNIGNSCRLFDVKTDRPIQGHKTLAELRKTVVLTDEYRPDRNELIWMTDCCPHESLPLRTTQYRQWFRFVTSRVGLWYLDHSTVNRLGIQPPNNVRIIRGSKFN